MGKSADQIFEMFDNIENCDFPPDLITIENMNAGGHLGGLVMQIKLFEKDLAARHAGKESKINPEKVLTSVNTPAVIYSILSLMQKRGICVPLSFAGGLTLDIEEQKQIVNFVDKYSKEFEFRILVFMQFVYFLF